MNTQQTTDAMRRCHYISAIGSQCNAPPMAGEHFCYSHNPRMAPERLEAQRSGGRNRRQPEPPPRIPPNLPYMKLESRPLILLVYEVTLNYVLQGEMDLRAANTLGYLAMGALMTLDSDERSRRQAALDAERAAEKAEKKAAAERAEKEKAARAAKAEQVEQEKTAAKAAKAAENAAKETAEKAAAASQAATQKIHAQQTLTDEIEEIKDKAQTSRGPGETQTEKAAQREIEQTAGKAGEKTGWKTEEESKTEAVRNPVSSTYAFVPRDEYGRKRRIIYRSTATGPEIEFVSNPRPPLIVSQTSVTQPPPSAEQGATGAKTRPAPDLG